jgi:AcrR family transcriptional regulator
MTRKEQIFTEALRLMRRKGYLNTSMRDIASAVEIEAASLYNHLKNKEELLESTCFGLAADLELGIKEVNDIYFDAIQKLRIAVKNHIAVITRNLDATHLFVHEWRHLTAEKRTLFISKRDAYEGEFRKIMLLGNREGLFKDVDAKFATLTVLATLNWVGEWYKPDGEMQPSEIADNLTNFILSGLQKN